MKNILFASLFILSSCGSMGLSEKEMPTYHLLDQTKEVCAQTLTNEVAAQTKCFPLLNDKELLIHVNKINLSTFGQGVVLVADVGPRYDVFCELTKEASEQLLKNPDNVQVGYRYTAKGRFTRYSQIYEHGIFTITDCVATGPVAIQ